MGLLNVHMFVYFVLIILELTHTIGGQNCSINCQPSVDAETPTCDPGTEACLFGCLAGFTGSLCDVNCGENCLNCSLDSDNVTVECNTCDVGFYHKDGDCLPCGSTCLANTSSSLPVCRQTDGRCEFGCKPTFFGALCNQPCSALCEGKQCHSDTGHCLNGCAAEVLSGDECTIPCNSGCVGSTCTQNGTCKHGCQVQSWGSACDSACSPGCQSSTESGITRTCNATDGACLFGCTDGQWGPRCERPCPQYCATNMCSVLGNCTTGCQTSWYGSHCNQTCGQFCVDDVCDEIRCLLGCKQGRWGPRCVSPCSENCVNNTCDKMYGNCTSGCKSGWYGSHCNRSCSPVCVDNVCDGVTGVCQCEEGVTGSLCIDVQEACLSERVRYPWCPPGDYVLCPSYTESPPIYLMRNDQTGQPMLIEWKALPGPGSEDTEEGSSIVALVFIVLGIVITLIFIVFCFYLVRREV